MTRAALLALMRADTISTSRKGVNLGEAAVAFVIGGTGDGDEWTIQYEGTADEPAGDELERLQRVYFARFPDARRGNRGRD